MHERSPMLNENRKTAFRSQEVSKLRLKSLFMLKLKAIMRGDFDFVMNYVSVSWS